MYVEEEMAAEASAGGCQGARARLQKTGFTSQIAGAGWPAGDKGLKGCDYIASEPAKVEKRCSRRVGEDGVPALEACKQTCGKC